MQGHFLPRTQIGLMVRCAEILAPHA